MGVLGGSKVTGHGEEEAQVRKDEMIAAGGRAIVKEMEFEDGAGASKDRERGSSCGGACSPLTLCTRDGTMRGRLYG